MGIVVARGKFYGALIGGDSLRVFSEPFVDMSQDKLRARVVRVSLCLRFIIRDHGFQSGAFKVELVEPVKGAPFLGFALKHLFVTLNNFVIRCLVLRKGER